MPLSNSIGRFAGEIVGSYQKAIRDILGGSLDSSQLIDAFAMNYARAKPGSDVEAQKRALQNSWFLSALMFIMGETASANLRIVQQSGNDQKPRDFYNHPFEQIYYRPNPYMTGDWMIRYTTLWLKADGNAYWYLLTDEDDFLEEIWPLPADRVYPIKEELGSGKFLDYYEYQAYGHTFYIDPRYICHFQNIPNPWNPFDGLSELLAGLLPIDADTAMLRWNAKFFAYDNVMPNAVINLKSGNPARRPNPGDVAALQSDLQSDYTASNRKTLVTGFPGGIDVELLGWSARDMDFVSGRGQTKVEIWNLMGVPEGVMAANTTEASAKVSVRILKDTVWTRTLVPMAQTITNTIIRKFYGVEFKAMYDDIRPVDRELAIRENEDFRADGTYGEVRMRQGLDEYKGPFEFIRDLPYALATNPQFVAEAIKVQMGIYPAQQLPEESPRPDEEPNEETDEIVEVEKAQYVSGSDNHTAMISIDIPYAWAVDKMSIGLDSFPDGAEVVPLDERHITLKYLGETKNLDLLKIQATLQDFTAQEQAFEVDILGRDRMYSATDEKDFVYYAVRNHPVSNFRARLNEFLKQEGLGVDDTYPNYLPHITIAYLPRETPLSVDISSPGTFPVKRITLHFGDQTFAYPLLTDNALADMKAWREKAIRKGREVSFESEYIPVYVQEKIRVGLSRADDEPANIKAVFVPYYAQ